MRLCSLLSIAFSFCVAAGASHGAVHVVEPGLSLQAAIDAASPGDTVLVRPGIYTAAPGARAVAHVRIDDLTLIGSLGAMIDARGATYGVLVGDDPPPTQRGCPSEAVVTGFEMRGFTVNRAGRSGTRLMGVEDYRVSHGVYLENAVHAVAAACSRHGRIDHNLATQHSGAAMLASSTDEIRIDHNILKHNGIGIEFENSINGVANENWLTNNSAGVLVAARPGFPLPFVENVSIEHNWIAENNRAGTLGSVPVGSGILNLGGDDVRIRKNTVIGNDSFGIASFANPSADLDERLEPFVDGLVVSRNITKGNGDAPDLDQMLVPGADLVFISDLLDRSTGESLAADPDPTDNCFADNHFDTNLPAGVADRFACY